MYEISLVNTFLKLKRNRLKNIPMTDTILSGRAVVGCCVVVVVVVVVVVGTTELVVTTSEPCENDDVGSISTVVEDIIIFSVDVAMATDVGIDDIRALVETFIITELRSVLESVSETCIDVI